MSTFFSISQDEVDEYVFSHHQIQTVADKYPSPKMDSLLYDFQLFQKDLILNTHKKIMTDQMNLSSGLALIMSKFAYNKALVTEDYWKRDSLFRNINEYQRLVYSDVKYDKADSINDITIDSLRHCIASDAVAIEFGNFREFDDFKMSDFNKYYALLLFKDKEYPIYIPLFNGSELKKNNFNWTVSGEALTDVIWKKITPHLKGIKSIYFAPSGDLHQIPIENLPMSSGKCMADLYDVYRVSSTGVIVEKKRVTKPEVAYVYGGIVNSKHHFLEGSEAEAIEISSILREQGVEVHLREGETATDNSLQDIIDERCKIIHIATHAFYYSLEEAKVSDYFKERQYIFDLNDPMLRCGIVLAPSDVYSSYSPFYGMLTASQIAYCDFSDCSLLVLSSCGSGLGDVKSEGVYGLSRAFRMAGAKTVVMSLWDVDDKATTIFMSAFYKALASGWNKHSAFNTARRTLRNTPGYSSHLYWASFIMLD